MLLLPIAFLLLIINIEIYISDYNIKCYTGISNVYLGTMLFFYYYSNNSVSRNCLYNVYLVLASYIINTILHGSYPFPYLAIILPFIIGMAWSMACNGNKEVEEIKKSYFFSSIIHDFLTPIYVVNIIFYYTKFGNRAIEEFNYNTILTGAFAITIHTRIGNLSILCYNYVKDLGFSTEIVKRKGKMVKKSNNFISEFLFAYSFGVFSMIVFYLNYNTQLGEYLYELLMNKVDHPNNIIIYNSIPSNSDVKYKTLIYIGYYAYAKLKDALF